MADSAISRLQKEYKKLEKTPVENILAVPDPKSIFEWHFMIHGLKDSVYSNGYYHGKIIFPIDYPFKPPKLMFITPSGRFKTNEAICLSFTNFHPESWNASMTIENMLIALISFMNSEERTTGSVEDSSRNRRVFAMKSLSFNLENPDFVRVFKSYFERLDISEQKSKEMLEKTISQPNLNGTEDLKKSLFLLGSLFAVLIAYVIFKSMH